MPPTNNDSSDTRPAAERRERPPESRRTRRFDSHVLDSAFRSLANRRRRSVLVHLLELERGETTLDELVDAVVARETDSSAIGRASVAISLRHSHLPKLADDGLVDWDADGDTVALTDRTERIAPVIEFARQWETGEKSERKR